MQPDNRMQATAGGFRPLLKLRSTFGKNEGGSQVSRGIYLYRLEAGSTTLTRKMILH